MIYFFELNDIKSINIDESNNVINITFKSKKKKKIKSGGGNRQQKQTI